MGDCIFSFAESCGIMAQKGGISVEKRIRVALVGFGQMGRNYAMMLGRDLVPELELTGVCCRREEGRALLRQTLPNVTVYESVEEMVRRAAEFDAALIVTPHTSHVSIGMALAKQGKHLLMDKPAGIYAGQVLQMAEFCREQGLAFGMIFNNRMLPGFRTVKRYLQEGRLGTLHRAVWVCNSWYRSPAYHRSSPWRSSWNGECGGMMTNQNPHYMDMWQWLFGMPDRVYAEMGFGRYNDFRVDDAVDLQLSYDSGFHGTFVSATGESPGINRLEIWGSKGKLTLKDNRRLIFDENQVSTEEFGRVNRELFAAVAHESSEIPLEKLDNPYLEVFSNFGRHLLTGEPLHADGWDGLRTTELINAVYVSGWEQCRVVVPVAEERFRTGLKKRQKEETEQGGT